MSVNPEGDILQLLSKTNEKGSHVLFFEDTLLVPDIYSHTQMLNSLMSSKITLVKKKRNSKDRKIRKFSLQILKTDELVISFFFKID